MRLNEAQEGSRRLKRVKKVSKDFRRFKQVPEALKKILEQRVIELVEG